MSKRVEWFKDLATFVVGGCLYALAVNLFTLPANIAPGGLTGVATLLHHIGGFPVGTTVLVLNLPLFFLSYRYLGRGFLAKTVIATVLVSILIDLFALIVPPYTGNRLLAAIYGGVFSGLGLSLVFLRGGTTGGTDIIAKLLVRWIKSAAIGQMILLIDGIIILLSALVYQNIDSGLYACVVIFTSTTIIDRLLYNAGMGKVVYIISRHCEEVTQLILTRMERGVTVLDGIGGYSRQPRQIVFCVVRRNEVWRVKQLVKTVDPTAFMIVGDAGQVLGEGFSPLI